MINSNRIEVLFYMVKLKVIWICHFSNKEVRERLPLSKMKVKNSIKSLLGKKINPGYSDFAPWVSNLIKEFEKFDEVELHVVSPFSGLTHLKHRGQVFILHAFEFWIHRLGI